MHARWASLLFAGACCAAQARPPAAAACQQVDSGFGPAGTVAVRAETVVSGLEVPWSIGFLPGGDLLVTERPGRLRLVRAGRLEPQPVAEVAVAAQGEGGLLGLALHPDFANNRSFYLYYTTSQGNRIERWKLAADSASAQADRVVFAGIAAASTHDGGRLRFGPDGMLYAGTGDAREPSRSQDLASPNGKLLRLTPDGDVPKDNPWPGKPAFIAGARNLEAFTWLDDRTLVLADHGPSGELSRTGHDEIDVAAAGDNLGWPTVYGCEDHPGMVAPALTWAQAVPPGGIAFYRGDRIPGWTGSLLVGTLGSRHLHRVVLDGRKLLKHEVYFAGDPPEGLGRLRDVVISPDGQIYVTTSNCDGRGTCPADKDRILRIIDGG